MYAPRTLRLVACSIVVASLVPLGLGSAHADDVHPWEGAPLQVPAETFREAAAAIPEVAPSDAPNGVQYLHDDHLYELTEDGRYHYTRHRVFRIVSETGVERAGFDSVTWRPWFEERPQLEARVFTPDGRVQVLAPDTIGEQPVQGGTDQLTDAKRLTAPIPALTPGAVVELVVRLREHRAPYRSGRSGGFLVGTADPTARWRVRIAAPADLPFRWIARGGATVEPTDERVDGGRVITFLQSPPARLPAYEPGTPSDVSAVPFVRWATGRAWADVAAEYAAVVGGQLEGADVAALAERLAGDAHDARTLVQRFLAWSRDELRYTGVEFGAAAYVPVPPATVLERGYGDCKDLSTLLVALLAARGVEAHVALLRVGSELDVAPELPSLDGFDHAIVHVPGSSPLWVDPTRPHTLVGQLPEPDQGRRALVARRGEAELVTLPRADAEENTLSIVRTVRLHHDGTGDVVHEARAAGTIAASYREAYARDPDGLRTYFEGYGKRDLKAGGEVSVRLDAPADRDPVVLTIEAPHSGLVKELDYGAQVPLPMWFLLSPLPDPLTQPFASGGEADERWKAVWLARDHDLVIQPPQVRELHYRILAPPGFVATKTPPESTITAGPVTVSSRVTRGNDGNVEVRYRLDTGAGRLTPAETRALHEKLMAWSNAGLDEVALFYEPHHMLEMGRLGAAMKRASALAAAHPDSPFLRAAFAETLTRAGVPDAGTSVAAWAVERFPDAAHPKLVLGWSHMHGDLGGWLTPGNDRAAAIEAFAALAALPDGGPVALARLGEAYAYDDAGRLLGPGTDAAKALATLEKLRAAYPDDGRGDELYLQILVAERRFADARKVAPSLPASVSRNRCWVRALAAAARPGAVLDRAAALAEADHENALMVFLGALQLALIERTDAAVRLMDAALKRRPDWRPVFEPLRAALVAAAPETPPPVSCSLIRDFARGILTDDPELVLRHVPDELREQGAGIVEQLGPVARNAAQQVADTFGLAYRDSAGTAALNLAPPCQVQDDGGAGFAVGGPAGRFRVFVYADGDDVTLIPPTHAAAAVEALKAVDAGRPDAARTWLQRATELAPIGYPLTVLSATEWLTGQQDPRRLADEDLGLAASLAALPLVPEALERIEARFRAAPAGPERRTLGRAMMVAAELAHRWDDVLRLVPDLEEAGARPADALGWRFRARLGLDERDEAFALLQAAYDEGLDGRARAVGALAGEALRLGDFVRGRALMEEAKATGEVDPAAWTNKVAWLALFDGGSLEEALALLGEPERHPARMHTRATLLAFLDRPAEAIDWLRRSVEARSGESLQPDDFVVLGRIAEGLGAHRAAAAYYERVEPSDPPSAVSCHVLAQRGLGRLDDLEGGLD